MLEELDFFGRGGWDSGTSGIGCLAGVAPVGLTSGLWGSGNTGFSGNPFPPLHPFFDRLEQRYV